MSKDRRGRGTDGRLPKLLGVCLVALASFYAIDRDWPVALGNRKTTVAEPSVRPTPRVHSMRMVRGEGDGSASFRWLANFQPAMWHLVLLDQNRRELAWSEALTESEYQPQGEFKEALDRGLGRRWYVIGWCASGQVRSAPSRVSLLSTPR